MLGTELIVGTESLWATAIEPVDPAVPSVTSAILRGREPIRADEIALGELTPSTGSGAHIGDRIPVTSSLAGAEPVAMTLVGTAAVELDRRGQSGTRGDPLARRASSDLVPGQSATIFVVDLEDGEPGRDGPDRAGRHFRRTPSWVPCGSRPCATWSGCAWCRGCYRPSS